MLKKPGLEVNHFAGTQDHRTVEGLEVEDRAATNDKHHSVVSLEVIVVEVEVGALAARDSEDSAHAAEPITQVGVEIALARLQDFDRLLGLVRRSRSRFGHTAHELTGNLPVVLGHSVACEGVNFLKHVEGAAAHDGVIECAEVFNSPRRT